MVKTQKITIKTKGNCDVVDITGQVNDAVARSGINDGVVCVFYIGSTAGVNTAQNLTGRDWLITILRLRLRNLRRKMPDMNTKKRGMTITAMHT